MLNLYNLKCSLCGSPVEELRSEADNGEIKLFGGARIVSSTGNHLSSRARIFACVVCGHLMTFLTRESADGEEHVEQRQISN